MKNVLGTQEDILTALLMAFLDAAFFLCALQSGLPWYNAHLAAFCAAFLLTIGVEGLYRRSRSLPHWNHSQFFTDILIACCILFLRGGLLSVAIDVLGVGAPAAGIAAAVFSAAAYRWGTNVWSLESAASARRQSPHPSRRQIVSLIGFVVLLRLLYGSSFALLQEEAYYWLYARHLDIGYLDHPPMVGWLIWVFTSLFGSSEFVIRLPAFICWLIGAGYAARLSSLVGGKAAGRRTLLLMALLPVFFATGMIMTPDAPLVACWAAALYYLYLALIVERADAWLGVGISMGLGMLSKYTMVLLGGAVWGYLVITPEGRKWLRKPAPYLAALLAVSLFSPVIVWNAEHDWASFYFQAIGRHKGGFNFGLQDLIGSALFLLTPVGLLSLLKMARSHRQLLRNLPRIDSRRGLHMLAWLTVLPLSVFFVFSLFRMSKLHWTAPIWLGVLPYLAIFTRPLGRRHQANPGEPHVFPRLWPLTSATLMLLYGGLLHYLAIGLPGIPYPQNVMDLGKRSLAHQIHQAANTFAGQDHEQPMVICWDSYKMASWMAYYLYSEESSPHGMSPAQVFGNTTGAHLFGKDSKMFRYWHPIDNFENRNLLLISDRRRDLECEPVMPRTVPISVTSAVLTLQNGKPTGTYYYRFFTKKRADSRQRMLDKEPEDLARLDAEPDWASKAD